MQVKFFTGLTRRQMRTVANALVEESILAGVTLIVEGLISRKFFYITVGQVQVIVLPQRSKSLVSCSHQAQDLQLAD
jgi:hypothetical protein